MAKKNWLFIKRGLSEDPKHRESMGMAVWLFMHICDAADWETGIVHDWRDKDIAADMSLNQRTVRDWRDRLSGVGYITCNPRQYGLDIIIHNWTNPRDYSGKKFNVRQGDMDTSPSEFQVDTQVDTQVGSEYVTPTSDSSSLSSPLSGAQKQKVINNANKTVDAILDNAKKALGSWQGREKMPEPLRDLGDAFVNVTGIKPQKKELAFWMGEFQDWLGMGVKPSDLQEVKAYSTEHGYDIFGPSSMTKTLRMLIAKKATKPKPIYYNPPPPPPPTGPALTREQYEAEKARRERAIA